MGILCFGSWSMNFFLFVLFGVRYAVLSGFVFLCFLIDSGVISALFKYCLFFRLSILHILFIFVSFGHWAVFWVITVDIHLSLLNSLSLTWFSLWLIYYPTILWKCFQLNKETFLFPEYLFARSLCVWFYLFGPHLCHCFLYFSNPLFIYLTSFISLMVYIYIHYIYISFIFGIWQFQDLLVEKWRNSKYVF